MIDLTPVSFRKGRPYEPRLSAPYVPGKRHERYWTDDEIATLRERYPAFGARGCIAFLPRHGVEKIYAKANALGLKAPGNTAKRQRLRFTAEMDARIREAFPGLTGRGAVAALADELGLRRDRLSRRLAKLDLTMPRLKEPAWTDAEVALMRRVPLHDPDRCSQIFREHGFARSATSIKVKARRLNISRRTHETLSAQGAAKILGVDAKYVTARCIDGRLKAGRRNSQRLTQQGGDAWAIEAVDLRRFIIDHIGQVDVRKVDKIAFVTLLVGADAIDPQAGAPPGDDAGLREANRALCEQVAALQAENARLRTLADRSEPAAASARQRVTWRDRLSGRDRRRA